MLLIMIIIIIGPSSEVRVSRARGLGPWGVGRAIRRNFYSATHALDGSKFSLRVV